MLYCLTGQWLADISIYSATGLLDIYKYTWDDEALTLAGIHPAQLPPLASPLTNVGKLTEDSARITGLPRQTPVILGASDGALANLGSGASLPGQNIITVGTSGAVRRVVAEPYLDIASPSIEKTNLPHKRTWCYVLTEGRWFSGGASLTTLWWNNPLPYS